MRERRTHTAFPLHYLVLACLAVLSGGCAGSGHESFRHELAIDGARLLYAPIASGQERIAEILPAIGYRAALFSLAPSGITELSGPLRQEHLLDGTVAIFLNVPPGLAGETGERHYFDPRKLRLFSMDARGTGKNGSDIVRVSESRFSIVRSLPGEKKRAGEAGPRGLYRFDFAMDKQGDPRPLGSTPLTAGPVDFMPAVLPSCDRVYYLRKEEEKNRLMSVDLKGGTGRPALFFQDFDIANLCRLPADGILFSANPEGHFRPYTLEDGCRGGRGNVVRLFKPPLPAAAMTSRHIFVSRDPSGSEPPRLVRLPEVVDLPAVCALVEAHNPHVNKKRALLGAALIDAKQARLANWPSLNWGLFYTPAVGIFLDDPISTSGDFLAEGISRGILGLVQPLLDFKRNSSLEQAKLFRAKVAHYAVLNEINQRIAEAAELYVEAVYLERLLSVEEALGAVLGERRQYYENLRSFGESTLSQLLAADQVISGIDSEGAFHRDRLSFLKSRLKELCGLPEYLPLELEGERVALGGYVPEPLAMMRHTALMEHPTMKAAAAVMTRAFHLNQAGPKIRPFASMGGTYGQSRQKFNDPVDDYITLALQGSYPLAGKRATENHREYWEATRQALGLERYAQARSVSTALEEALMDFKAAQRDFDAKRATRLYRLENLRVARLHRELGPPDDPENLSPAPLFTARFLHLEAVSKLLGSEKDMGLRFAKLWREMGLSRELAGRWGRLRRDRAARERPSLWLWRTEEVLASDASMAAFIASCSENRIGRVYAYLHWDSDILAQRRTRERFTVLLNLCHRKGITLWGLLGEPEWLEEEGLPLLRRAVGRIIEFNDSRGPFQPVIKGIKLDLEPHSLPGWRRDPERRKTLGAAYLALLEGAREEIRGRLPLWADIPMDLFRPENRELREGLLDRVDGATLMAYADREQTIAAYAERALGLFSRPLEIGVEFSPLAPPHERLSPRAPAKRLEFVSRFVSEFGENPVFSGVAFHDYTALAGIRTGGDGRPETAGQQRKR